jgi:hypothetical protein
MDTDDAIGGATDDATRVEAAAPEQILTAADLPTGDQTSSARWLLSLLFQQIDTGRFDAVDDTLVELARTCPAHSMTAARIVFGCRPGTALGPGARGWWTRPPELGRLVSAYAGEALSEAATTGRPPGDVAADFGWVVALGLEVMQPYPSTAPGALIISGMSGALEFLEQLLGATLSNGVAFTCLPGRCLVLQSADSTVLARSWRGQPSLRRGHGEPVVAGVERAISAQAAFRPDRTRPPPALVEFSRITSGPAGFDDGVIHESDEVADRLAAALGRESAAAPVFCRSRRCLIRTISAGNIRPTDALTVLIAMLFDSRTRVEPVSSAEIAYELAIRLTASQPPTTAPLQLPPVIL